MDHLRHRRSFDGCDKRQWQSFRMIYASTNVGNGKKTSKNRFKLASLLFHLGVGREECDQTWCYEMQNYVTP